MGKILVVEFQDEDNAMFEKIMRLLQHSEGFSEMILKTDYSLSVPGMKIDMEKRVVLCEGREIRLTTKEFDVLCTLATNRGTVLTYGQIYQNVWGEPDYENASNAIACHIHNLKSKLNKVMPSTTFSIRCVREVGYCFEVNE